MILKIRQVGEEVLRQSARELSRDEILHASTQDLIGSMRETMQDAPGVGLAAPQVGYALQLAVIEDKPEYVQKLSEREVAERARRPVPFHVLVNPRLIRLGPDTEAFFEGCLSLAGYTAIVPRSMHVRVECLNEKAEPTVIEAGGWYARILQHEIDHLGGTLYIDRMNSGTFCTQENYIRHWKERSVADVLNSALGKSRT